MKIVEIEPSGLGQLKALLAAAHPSPRKAG